MMTSLPEEAHCLKCDYCLFGLSGPVCPECGHSFNPDDSTTYRLGPAVLGKRHLRIAVIGLATVVVSPFFSAIGQIPGRMTPGIVVYLALLSGGYLTELVISIVCIIELVKKRIRDARKGRLVAALVLSLIIVVGCPGLPYLFLLLGYPFVG